MCRLTELRAQRKLTRQELAQRAGCTSEAIRLLEKEGNFPALRTAYAIADALQVSVEYIWPRASKTPDV